MLRLENVSYTIGGTPLVHNISTHFAAGMFVGIIGPNGAGKSTLLRLAAGLAIPDTGEVLWQGEQLAALPHFMRARNIAWLAQDNPIEWPMRGRDIVGLARLPFTGGFGKLTAQDETAIACALEDMQAQGFADRLMTTLSGGERALILLARLLAGDAPLYLADEPIQSLDPHRQLHVLRLLQMRARNHHAVIAVLHDIMLAKRFCTHLILMHNGRIITQGETHAVSASAHMEDVFATDFLRATHKGESYMLPWRAHD